MNIECPECKYKHAEKFIEFKVEKNASIFNPLKGVYLRVVNYYCPKCDFSKKNKNQIDYNEYVMGIRSKGTKQSEEAEVEVNLKAKGRR